MLAGKLMLNKITAASCSTIIDSDNYSILTTQRLVIRRGTGQRYYHLANAVIQSFGDFKKAIEDITFGLLKLPGGEAISFHIETGKASMVMIHGIKTLLSMHTYRKIDP